MRLAVVVPPDKVPDDRTMTFFVDCDTTFTVDNVKWTLLNQIYATTGKAPRISSFQLQQEGKHPRTLSRSPASSRSHPFGSCVLHPTAISKNIRSLSVVVSFYSCSHVFSVMQVSMFS